MPISHALKIAEGGAHIKHYNQAVFEFQCRANEKVIEWDLDTFFFFFDGNRLEPRHLTCREI